MGIFFIERLLQKFSTEEIFVKTYNSVDNQLLVNFLKSQNILYSTSSYKNIDMQKITHIDVLACVFSREKVPTELVDIARISINYHPSLLPKYKGCFSVPWALINGEKETGYTIHELSNEFDCGDIFYQRKIMIDLTDTSYSLYAKIKSKIIEDIPIHMEILSDKTKASKTSQIRTGDYYPRQLPHEGYINKDWEMDHIDRFIRAMIYPPHSPAKIKLENKEFEIYNIKQYIDLVK